MGQDRERCAPRSTGNRPRAQPAGEGHPHLSAICREHPWAAAYAEQPDQAQEPRTKRVGSAVGHEGNRYFRRMGTTWWQALLVAGVSGGAGIAGALSAVALTGRRADRQRRDDQEREDRLRAEEREDRHVEQWRAERQAVYSECMAQLQLATELINQVGWVGRVDANFYPEIDQKLSDAVDRFRLLAGRIPLVSGLPSIPEAVTKTQLALVAAWSTTLKRDVASRELHSEVSWKSTLQDRFNAFTSSREDLLTLFRADLGITRLGTPVDASLLQDRQEGGGVPPWPVTPTGRP